MKNTLDVESEPSDPCPCCAMTLYYVRGWDHTGRWRDYGPYADREDAEELLQTFLKEGEGQQGRPS